MKTVLFNTKFRYSQEFLEQQFLDFIFNKWKEEQLFSLTFVVPTSRLKDYIYESLASRVQHTNVGGLVFGLKIYSFNEFVSLLYSQVFINTKKTVISSGIQTSIFELACEYAHLEYYTNKELLKTGYIKDLSSLIFGVKEDAVTIYSFEQDYHKLLGEFDSTSTIGLKRFRDVIELYKQYEDILSTSLLDSTDLVQYCTFCLDQKNVFRAITEEDIATIETQQELYQLLLRNFLTKDLEVTPQIFFLEFFHFKKPEQLFIQALSEKEIGIGISFGSSHLNDEVFQITEAQIEYFSKNGFAPIYSNNVSDVEKNFAKHFGAYSTKRINKANCTNDLEIIEIASKKEEIAHVLSEVKKLTIEQHIPKEQICIISRDIESYSELLREESFNAEILLNITDRFPLIQSSVVIALFSILDIIIYGFRKKDIQKALRNPYLSFNSHYNHESNINGDNLIHVAEEMRFEGGFEHRGLQGWYQKLESEIDYYNQKVTMMTDSVHTTVFELESLQRKLQIRKKALEDLKCIALMLPTSDTMMSLKEFSSTIEEMIDTFQIVNNIKLFSVEIGTRQYLNEFERNFFVLEAERDGRALNSIRQILAEIVRVFSLFEKKSFHKAKKFSELVKRLRFAILTEKYQIREQKGSSILVTSIEQIRGIPFSYIFVLGMNQGVFPKNYTTEKVLGLNLEQTERMAMSQELYTFWMLVQRVLSQETQKLQLLYAQSSEKEMLLPSMYLGELQSILECTSKKIETPTHELSVISSKEQLLEYLATTQEIDIEIQHNKQALFFSELDWNIEEFHHNEYTSTPIVEQLSPLTIDEIASLRTKAFSSSKLEMYALCPYKYMVSEIIQIKEIQEIDEFLSSMNKGTIFHATVDAFFSTLLKKDPSIDANGLHFVQLDPQRHQEYSLLLNSLGETIIDEYSIDHPYFSFSKEYFLGSIMENQEKIYGLFDIWLESELRFLEQGWKFYPYFFELEFGALQPKYSQDKLFSSTESLHITDKTSIKGKIDRIEMRIGENGNYEAIISDYKLSDGSLPKLKDILDGKKYQLPLYAKAFEVYFAEKYQRNCQIKGGIYYAFSTKISKDKSLTLEKIPCFVEENILETKIKNVTVPSIEELINQTVTLVEMKVEELSSINFPIQPSKKDCARCSYSKICRYKELEV